MSLCLCLSLSLLCICLPSLTSLSLPLSLSLSFSVCLSVSVYLSVCLFLCRFSKRCFSMEEIQAVVGLLRVSSSLSVGQCFISWRFQSGFTQCILCNVTAGDRYNLIEPSNHLGLQSFSQRSEPPGPAPGLCVSTVVYHVAAKTAQPRTAQFLETCSDGHYPNKT